MNDWQNVQEEYMQLMLPLVNSTLDQIEAPATSLVKTGEAAPQPSVPSAQDKSQPPAPSAALQPPEGDTFIKVGTWHWC